MKKLLSVLVAIAMCACLCLTAFAADGDILSGLTGALGDLDLESFDLDSITAGLGDLTAGLGGTDGSDPLAGIKDTLGGLLGGSGDSSEAGGLGDFDPTGALSSFVDSLDLGQITELFSGLTDALGGLGISLPSGGEGEGSEGGFDINSILGGNTGDGAGVAGIMDMFGGVLEGLGLDSSIIESLGQSDIVNFFANLYMGSVPTPSPEPETDPPTTEKPHNQDTGVNDGAAVMAACATLSVAAAALFVCTRKKHA